MKIPEIKRLCRSLLDLSHQAGRLGDHNEWLYLNMDNHINQAYKCGLSDGVRWISVSDRLPRRGELVIVMGRGIYEVKRYYGFGDDILYWIPAPKKIRL